MFNVSILIKLLMELWLKFSFLLKCTFSNINSSNASIYQADYILLHNDRAQQSWLIYDWLGSLVCRPELFNLFS